MDIRILERKGFCVLGIVLVALLLVTACASPTTPQGQRVVEIGAIPTLTGGGASAEQPSFQGTLDYVRYFNEEKSIPGVTIELVWRDCATEIERWMSAYQVLAERKIPIISTAYCTFLGNDFSSTLEENGTVLFMTSTAPQQLYPPGWFFCAWPTYGETTAAFLEYFMENWKEQRPPRLQFLVIDTMVFGRETAADATEYAESIGFEVMPLEIVPIVVIDATVQLIRIRERQPDLVWIQHVISGAGPIMRDAERLELQEQMQFGGPEFLMGKQLLAMAPVSMEGFLAPKYMPAVDDTSIPGVKTMQDVITKYHGKASTDPATMFGWVYGAIMCESVKRAGEEVGYDNIDGAAVKRALENMQGFDAAGIVKMTFGPEDRRGSTRCAIYQIQGGKIVRVSDYGEVPMLSP